MKRTCKQCGKEFILTQFEIDFYKSKNLSLPKRCKECREQNKKSTSGGNKNNKLEKEQEKQEDYSSYVYKPKKKKTGRVKKSIVTGAAVVVLGLGGFFAKDQINQPVETPVAVEQVDAGYVVEEPVAEVVEEPVAEVVEETSAEPVAEVVEEAAPEVVEETAPVQTAYRFKSNKLLNEHYEKHGKDMGFASAEDYQAAASAVVNNPNALHKLEKEDGDDVYYVEATNEFVVVSTQGYIRTYFYPDSGKKYYDKQ